eukprot:396044-Hanusia_phi.AAC.1
MELELHVTCQLQLVQLVVELLDLHHVSLAGLVVTLTRLFVRLLALLAHSLLAANCQLQREKKTST